jgi:putative phosphoesterase
MKKIGILSDTHGYIDSQLFRFFESCDELWHAGDIGDIETYDLLNKFKPTKAVWGNIDGHIIRATLPEIQSFTCEKIKVCMLHIAGKPGKYTRAVSEIKRLYQPDLLITGHSHILKVMKDKNNGWMYMNPGAAGNKGFHQFCTALRLKIEGSRMYDLEVWEKPRG